MNAGLYFTDVFGLTEDVMEDCGAFNVSLVVDLPLFVDPFLLFNSVNPTYQNLHSGIIEYLRYLRDAANRGQVGDGRLRELYCFPEVKQTWLGFSRGDNAGRGLGMKFARALAGNLHDVFNNFGHEGITRASHLEKLCLIRDGVGRDTISDFTTNLIRRFLCEYTQVFAHRHIPDGRCRLFAVSHVDFHPATGSWAPATFRLPEHENDFVLLTPKDILTKDDTWINKQDFVREYHDIPTAIGDAQLREKIDVYFQSVLPRDADAKETAEAIRKTALRFPELFDYYIKLKEDTGREAEKRSMDKVEASFALYVRQFGKLVALLKRETSFYNTPIGSREAAIKKILFLKDVVENKGGFRLFYNSEKPIRREEDLQICYRLVWHETNYDVSREVNDGRGPADFKISFGAHDKTIVEMKLASNTGLQRNLERQAEIYQKASDAQAVLKVILFFTEQERHRVDEILKRLNLDTCTEIFLIDARSDNKPSASKA